MKKCMIMVCLALCLCGCYRQKDNAVRRNLITQITITCDTETGPIYRYYTTPQKMRPVLLYIRSIRTSFDAPEEPDPAKGNRVRITTVSVDQTVKTYCQQGNAYFQTGEGKWQSIDSEKGVNLWTIIKLLPSDPE